MDTRLIIAVIRRDKLEEVEQKLHDVGVERIDVSNVKGYGEYRNFFTQDWMSDEVRVEIFTRKNEVEAIATAIVNAAHTGLPGDGVVAVLPIETLYLVRTRAEATPHEFWPARSS
jgi:nitrogen regulatory protein P-II 1